nr:MAG TPA: hypothetical protein [Caudoviricetes sp.]
MWRSRQKAANRVRIQDACKVARWKVTGWAGDSADMSTQQNSDYNHS